MELDYRVISEKKTKVNFSIVWRNVGNVPLDVPRFVYRADRIKEHMKDINADIMCFSECRDSEAIDDNPPLPINKFLAEVAGSRYEIFNQSGVATPSIPAKKFYLSILVDKSKFYVECSKMVPLSYNLFYPLVVNKDDFNKSCFNRSLHCMKLFPLIDNKINYLQPFWIITTHLNIPKDNNLAETNFINDNIEKITNGEPYILTGDFNYFPESGRSEEQEDIMKIKHDDCFSYEVYEYNTDRELKTTFVGFINDSFRNKNIYKNENRLDRVYVNKKYSLKIKNKKIDTRLFLFNGIQYYEEENKIDRFDFPSDHFPLVFDVEL
jgi:hypothetical protein